MASSRLGVDKLKRIAVFLDLVEQAAASTGVSISGYTTDDMRLTVDDVQVNGVRVAVVCDEPDGVIRYEVVAGD